MALAMSFRFLRYQRGFNTGSLSQVRMSTKPEDYFTAKYIPEKGKTYDKKPFKMMLHPGKTYTWCMCGYSHSQVRHCTTAGSDNPVTEKKGVIAGIKPIKLHIDANKRYSWCACGLSEKQPLCDGMHKIMKSELKPVRFTLDEAKEVWLCNCKQTNKRPYCDGTHKHPDIQAAVR
ncbi:PREDICTED: CDGSH iron-sulfur domain-containing protein 3, mitochondrial-like [Priapulus caudatus]|uniref:CDGSH iron-sulfur domain-containing protein 3, mitochondrial-like n=1 Tax=Priapulus caudatus TaxID=37621 RepID=A0ABM1ER22_PRICU|nr:PREDICTED: CDGSH iron-sulfur domain-containing protein 3, mitochondrial-like [Priapulus caudatus]